jgi:hypothetical protein
MRSSIVLAAILLSCAAASAQTPQVDSPPIDPDTWRRGTTLNVFGGLTGGSGDLGTLAGGALGWEITPRIALEAHGAWTEWGHDAHAFSAAFRALVPLRASRSVSPFVAGGVGLYRSTFQVADADAPEFYLRRIGERTGALGTTATFTDPSVVVGGGVNLFLTRQIAVRPELDATIVARDGHRRATAEVRVHFAYHFEDHPITPLRR